MDDKAHIYQFDNVRVDPVSFRLWKAERVVQVEPKAFQVLLFLIENRGRLIEKRELLDAVWKETFVTENALTREIAQLRKALGENARQAKYIETVPTRGYRFIADVEIKNGRKVEATKEEEEAEIKTRAGAHLQTSELSTPAIAAVKEKETGRKRRFNSSVVLVCAIALLLLAGIFFWNYFRQPASEARGVRRNTQVTTWLGLDAYPALSPDGSSIAYTSNHDGNFEIYVKPLTSGGREIQITSDGEQNFEPAWSPDGQYIAYHCRNRGGIWVIPALGGVARRLTDFGSKPAWSRDGSMIAFQSQALIDLSRFVSGALPPSTIWTMPAQGGQPVQITQLGLPAGGHSSPTWSPDGKRIVFFGYDNNIAAIWSVAAVGGDLKQLTNNQHLFFDPVYAPDGKNIYCAGISASINYGLWRIPVSPSTGERLGDAIEVQNTGTQTIKNLSISVDGKKIVYGSQSLTSDIWTIPLSPASSEAAGDPFPLMQDRSARKANPSISPDGKRIAFGIWRAGAPGNVWLMDADGKNPSPINASTASTSLASWLSNDEVTYVTYRQDDNGMLSSINLKTGVERALFPLQPDMEFMRLSPDGRELAYNSIKNGTINIWKVALANGQPRQLTFDKELAGWPIWSPDGRVIAFELRRGDDTHIALIPSEGGEITQLTNEHGQSWPHSWSPDGSRIAFAGLRNGVWNVWWVSVKDRTEKQLTNFNKLNAYVRYPAWSPAGNQIVFEYAEMTGNIWMMELK